MAKLPVPGRVKTRLVPPLRTEDAARVQAAFLSTLLARLSASANFDAVVWCHTGGAMGEAEAWASSQPELSHFQGNLSFVPQVEGDLGDRLAGAASVIRGTGKKANLCYFGVDSPHLPARHIDEALRHLAAGRDCIGPCEDGGFWCLGVTPDSDVGAITSGIDWSSGRELGQVRARAVQAGRPLVDLPTFWDVDRPDDLARLLQTLAVDPEPTAQSLYQRLLRALPVGVTSQLAL